MLRVAEALRRPPGGRRGALPHRPRGDLWPARAERGGKTTTISMLCGIIGRDEGEVVVAGEQAEESNPESDRRRRAAWSSVKSDPDA